LRRSVEGFGETSKLVSVVPVHPVPKADGLLGLNSRKIQGSLLASLDELCYSITFDLAFSLETKFFLNLNFHPEALTIEAILVAKPQSLHRLEALKEIFVHAGSRVMKTHRIVRRDRPV
jgi:hypothetical protein